MRLATADYICGNCGRVLEDIFIDEADNTECVCNSKKLKRIFSFSKYKEFEAGFYENFEHKPIYIESKEQFKKECKKRGLERVY